MKDCSSTSVVPPSAFRTTVRKESTTTTPGLAFSTSFVISSRTASRVLLQHNLAQVDKADGGV